MWIADNDERERFAQWRDDGNVWVEAALSSPEEPCQFCRATWSHKTIPLFREVLGGLGAFMCESETPLPNTKLN
jgi:hypothetical protein